VVATRFERSRTAQTLAQVNDLFAQGQVNAALGLLKQQQGNLERASALAHKAPRPSPKLDKDIRAQQQAVDRASVQPSAAPSSREGKTRSKKIEEENLDFRN